MKHNIANISDKDWQQLMDEIVYEVRANAHIYLDEPRVFTVGSTKIFRSSPCLTKGTYNMCDNNN
jgi:hypothetical protein